MRLLKIKYVDFWYGFSERNNYFTSLLSQWYDLEFSENPEILIYSCYGREHLKYTCLRIFYSAENLRPDFNGCDYAISFDYINHPKHFRFPLYGIYLDREVKVNQFLIGYSFEEAIKIWRSKTKFCCMVVSNGASQKRIDFFKKLSEYKKVDSGGQILNNVGGPVKNKLDFIKDYRFVIAFENSSYPGYTTEKIIEPFITDCIPLYWGNSQIREEFNDKSLLILDENMPVDSFIEMIKEIDTNESKAVEMLMQFKFRNGILPSSIDKNNLIKFFHKVIETRAKPIATTFKGKKYFFVVVIRHFINRVKAKFI
ncbi:MAG: glycosyltransferase [Bacteroidetes bacterium]|nr:glycosyltransferase [Bacteroidota bacterium]